MQTIAPTFVTPLGVEEVPMAADPCQTCPPPLPRLSPLRRRQGRRRQRGQEAASWTACKSTHRSQEDVVLTTFYLEFHPAGQARKHEMVKRHLLAPFIATQAIDSYPRGILQLSTWCVWVCVQLHPALRDPMDYSLPGSSVHGTLQARMLE